MVWQIQWVPKLHSNLWACVDRQCWLLTVMIWVPTAPNLVDKMEAIVSLHTTLVCCWIEKVYIEQILAWGGSACDVRTSALSSLQMRWWGSFYDNHFSLISRSSYARREGSSEEDTLLLEVEPPTDRSDVRTLNNMFNKASSALHVWIALQGSPIGDNARARRSFPDAWLVGLLAMDVATKQLHEQCSSKHMDNLTWASYLHSPSHAPTVYVRS